MNPTKGMLFGRSPFKGAVLLVLFALCGAIALLFLADAAYISRQSMLETLQSKNIIRALILTLVFSLITTALAVLVAVPSGYALSRFPFRGMIVLDILIDALIVLPVLVIGISILVFFRQGQDLVGPGQRLLLEAAHFLDDVHGPLNHARGCVTALTGYILFQTGTFFNWLARFFILNMPGIVLAQFFCCVSYAVRVMKATFDEIDPRTEQVAMTLGCSRGGAFWRVSLPTARHGILAAAVLAWARAAGVYGPVHIVAGTIRGKTEVLPSSIYLEISVGRLESALAISILLIVMACGALLLLKTFSRSALFGGRGAR